MSYKIEIQNNFFVVTDTTTGIEEVREVRDAVKWRVSGSLYSFFYNIPNLVDQNSPNIIRLGENAKEFDFSEIVDSTETPFASRAIFNTLLNENLGFIIRETSSVWGLITGDINDQTDLQTVLNGKFDVPTGDTTQYIAGDGTLITFPVAGQAGTLVREVRNTTGATLTKGTVVYINGANGNKPTVAKAQANAESTSARTLGLLQSNISNNSNGFVVVIGDLTGLDTSAITEGTQLYLSSTVAGEYTTTKQVAPAHMVYVGKVTRSHPTLGQIEVYVQNGFELDELHDVLITSKTDGQVLQFESASGLWKNKTLATGLTVGSTAISGGVDGRILFQNGGVVQESNRFTFGTGLKVLSDGTNDSFVINNSADSSTLFKVTKEGYFYSNYYWQFNRLNGTTLELYSLTTGFSFREGGVPFALLGLNESKFGNTNTNDSVLAIRTSTAYGGEYPLGSIIQGLGTNGSVILSPLSGASFKGMLGYYNGTSYASALEYNNTTSGGTVVKLVQNGSGAVSIGQATNGARLDVKAQGALSTDLAFRVRNSADTADWIKIDGTGAMTLSNAGGTGPFLSFGKINGGSGYFYGDASSVLTYSTNFQINGVLYLQQGIGFQGYGKNISMNSGTITGITKITLQESSSIVMRPDFNIGATENNLGLFIAPNNTANPTKKLIKLMDSTLTDTYFAVNGSGQTSIGTTSPNASAKVQIDSTTQGFLPPRMTNAQRTAIATPAVGLMVYCTDTVEGLYIYKSTGWTFVI